MKQPNRIPSPVERFAHVALGVLVLVLIAWFAVTHVVPLFDVPMLPTSP